MTNSRKSKPTKGKAVEPTQDRSRLPDSPGNNIRAWRLFRGIETQQGLSELTKRMDRDGRGLSREVICRLETGELRYNEDHLTILALALEVAARDLIGTNPLDAGDIFAVYAGLSASDKRRISDAVAKLKRT